MQLVDADAAVVCTGTIANEAANSTCKQNLGRFSLIVGYSWKSTTDGQIGAYFQGVADPYASSRLTAWGVTDSGDLSYACNVTDDTDDGEWRVVDLGAGCE